MPEEITGLLVAAMIGALFAWFFGPRRVVVAARKPVVKHNKRGQRSVEDIAARLELEQAGRPDPKLERWTRFGWSAIEPEYDEPVIVLPSVSGRAAMRRALSTPELPSYDPGAWTSAALRSRLTPARLCPVGRNPAHGGAV